VRSPDDIPEVALVWCKETKRHNPQDQRRQPEKFLKGPVPVPWLQQAARLPGRSLEVGLCLWRLAGAMRSMTVALSTREVEGFGVDRHAKSRALKKLEAAGLVRVDHHRGRFPRVTIVCPNFAMAGRDKPALARA
jgi:hypothetical protein